MNEPYPDRHAPRLMKGVLQDLRHGARMLVKNPAFTIVAVLSLAVGIGANAATFSLADLLLFRPLPVPDPSEIVTVGSTNVATNDALIVSTQASYRDYVDVRDRSRSFSGLTASYITQAQFSVPDEVAPQVRTGMVVSGNYFRTMEVEPAVGRTFLPEEDQVPERNPVMVLSHGLWERQFGADAGVLGLGVRLNGVEYEIIGVAPDEFTGTDQWVRPEFYVPIMMWPALTPPGQPDPLDERGLRNLTLKGRLAGGMTLAGARAEIGAIGAALSDAFPDTNRNQSWFVRTEYETRITGGQLEIVGMLMTLAMAVLLVACANVAGLLTSRAPVRSGEIALRLAIGAGRGRIIRQLFTENLMLAVLGGLGGLGVGYLGVLLWRQMNIVSDLPIALVVEMNPRALLVSMAAAVASVFVFGLIPAVQTSRQSLTGALRNAAGGAPRRRAWGQSGLVIAQVATSLALLSVAGFVYGSFLRTLDAGPGFRTDHLLIMSFDPGMAQYDLEESGRFYEQLVEGAGGLSGVESAAIASFIPFSGTGAPVTSIVPDGYEFPEGIETADVLTSFVDAQFFDAMDITLNQGRAFTQQDSEDTPRVAVVNQQFVNLYWPNQNGVGKRFRMNGNDGPWVEIVGVVPTGRYFGLAEDPLEFIYMPYAQNPGMRMTLFVEARGDPVALVDPLRDVVRGLDSNMAAANMRTMEDFYQDSAVANTLVFIKVVAAMGVMGVILAFGGLYGLVTYGVSTRTREFGVRMAIGASQGDVLRIVLKRGLCLAVIGVAIGLVLTFGADMAMRAAFPGGGGSQRSPVEYVRFVVLLLAATALASYLPARRASHIPPTIALRED